MNPGNKVPVETRERKLPTELEVLGFVETKVAQLPPIMFLFQVINPQEGQTLAQQLDSVEQQLHAWMELNGMDQGQLLFSRTYLSDAANQQQAWEAHSLYQQILSEGAVSVIEQPAVGGEKISLWVWFVKDQSLRKSGSPNRLVAQIDNETLYFQSVRLSGNAAQGQDGCLQTEAAFQQHSDWLQTMGLNLRDHCLRTWLYVRDIDRHYADVVRGRNNIFAREGLTRETHYIASTGIGGDTGRRESIVAIDFLSGRLVNGDIRQLQALDYLNPTYEYGVAFERGTSFSVAGQRVHLLSGTASIDNHGECLHRGDVVTQAGRLLLNMEKLLNDGGATLGDLQHIVVYLRDMADIAAVRRYFRLRFPHLPQTMVMGRVCRPEWLIEVEGIAVTNL